MNISFDEKKIVFAKKILFSKNKGVYSDVFNLFKNEINELIEFGLKYRTILSLLENELDYTFKYKTFISWIQKNIKQKNQSTNTLRNSSQIKKEIKKEENKIRQTQNQSTSASSKKNNEDDHKPWWEKRLEELSKGMEEAAIKK